MADSRPVKPATTKLMMLRLRHETETAHERIEQVPALARLLAADYTLTEYQTLLGRLYGFYAPLEARLFAADTPLVGLQPKTPLLTADLTALGLAERLDTLPRCPTLPALSAPAQIMGSAYVLEGATLGGQLLRRQLLAHFGETIRPALNFYSGYGEQNGRQWRYFGELLAQRYDDADPMVQDSIVAAANATFTALQDWLEQR